MSTQKPLVIVDGKIRQLSSTDTLQVSGPDLSINGVSYAFPAEGASGVLTNDGSNNLSWSQSSGGILYVEGTDITLNQTPTNVVSLSIDDDTNYILDATIVGRCTSASDRASFIRRADVYRESAGSATILSTVDATFTRKSDASWDATLVVSGNNAAVQVTGASSKTIHWYARIIYMKVA